MEHVEFWYFENQLRISEDMVKKTSVTLGSTYFWFLIIWDISIIVKKGKTTSIFIDFPVV